MTSEELNQRFFYTPKLFVFLSILLHVFIVASFVSVIALDKLNFTPFGKRRNPGKEYYQEFIQVDVVALPDMLMGAKPSMVDATLPVVDKPRVEEAQTKPNVIDEQSKDKIMPEIAALEAQKKQEELKQLEKQKQQEALKKAEEKKAAALHEKKESEKKEREAALKRLAEEASREAALKSLAKDQKGRHGRLALKGNILAKGTSSRGKIGNAQDRYEALLEQKIRQHFNVYEWQQKKGLVAVVNIKLYPTGYVTEKQVVKPSADPLYDSAVLQAVDEAQPLPVPDDFSLPAQGINIEFHPDQ